MTPSALRTLVLADFQPSASYGVVLAAPALLWPSKQPAETLDYSLDVSAFLADAGDELAQVTVSTSPANPGDLAPVLLQVGTGVITAMLAGGQPGTDYGVQIELTTAQGRVLAPAGAISVTGPFSERGAPAAQPPLTTPAPLTWTMPDPRTGLIVLGVPASLGPVYVPATTPEPLMVPPAVPFFF